MESFYRVAHRSNLATFILAPAAHYYGMQSLTNSGTGGLQSRLCVLESTRFEVVEGTTASQTAAEADKQVLAQ